MKNIRYLIALLVVLAAVYFLPGQFASEFSYNKEFSLEKPPVTAFGNMLNPFNFRHWIPGYKSVHSVSGTMTSNGSINRLVLERQGEEISLMQQIENIEPAREFSALYEWKGWQLKNTIILSPAEGGSIMNVTASLHTGRPADRALLFWIRGRIESELDAMFTSLAGIINKGPVANSFPGS